PSDARTDAASYAHGAFFGFACGEAMGMRRVPVRGPPERAAITRGALRFDEIKKLTGAFPNDLLDALWRLVWSGEATNDTLAPVRSLLRQSSKPTGATGRPGSGRRGGGRRRQAYRSRRRDRMPGSEGRWSLVTPSAATPTERQAAIATQLVERHGVLTRPAVGREQTAGGFSAIYPVLKAMEESGRVRRGYFVEGLGGAQFAAAGADDLLRAKPDDTDEPQAVILAATDPANAYGAALPWPGGAGAKGGNDYTDPLRPQRAAGALVVLADGNLVGYVGRGGTKLTTFLADAEPDRSRETRLLAEALVDRAATRQPIRLEKIDGAAPEESPLAGALAEAGFLATSRGLLHRG
ncbi:MAG: hypothetical protein AAGB00_04865, partial [Planctomycetota bacterium]